MAMDLFCYSSKSPSELRKIIEVVANLHKEIFSTKFLISEIQDADSTHKETAFDYGFDANSFFMINYNDKSETGLSPVVVKLIKEALGADNVLVLFENEELR
ncbi:hypothetical protein [Variovorax guangxiensis]|uniref:hypothetical protein n=1 Tax=Variovorax guangxiensis TaxID=1775474 RepID=UPI0028601111|nr:hypothetical protein [Variovorax guangxiensis]MDR6856821.1 hypothetical protein [Variovorax guangxiensis]